ncbi:hypothetical protein ABH945_005939 [Paraburkholderia sp. GAS333]|uniref:DUF4148 domain-containing protein n=1 Tax=Paraburkholderia sp. GAS333 TaxID=3156279 RepID=UPI003D193250
MKVTMLALALAACAMTGSAYAANPTANSIADTHAASFDSQNTPHAKTRAEVRQELVRAEKDGQLAALNKFYQGS